MFGPVKEEMGDYLRMLRSFRETPDSSAAASGRLSATIGGRSMACEVVPLEDAEVKRIWDLVPWEHECEVTGQVFEKIPADTHKELRNAAFHLLWFGRELCRDREPLTKDKLV